MEREATDLSAGTYGLFLKMLGYRCVPYLASMRLALGLLVPGPVGLHLMV